MKKLYCCESSRGMYEDYYARQSGSGGPVYQGSQGQRGHGLGSMLSGLFRSAMPMIKRGLSFFGKHALKTGLDVANDVVAGSTFRDSASRRVPEGINRFVSSAGFTNQSGSGRRGRKRKRASRSTVNKLRIKKKKTSKKNKNKRKKIIHDDIFS